jgi:hypothetical protein
MKAAMTLRKEEIRKVEEAFKGVYRRERALPAASAWEDQVMCAIRRNGAHSPSQDGDFERFGHLVWRLSTATCLFALLLMVYAVISEQGTASEATKWFFEDPLGVDLMHSLGIV